MPRNLHVPAHIHALAGRGALFVVNHSGGKDSQAMHILLSRAIPAEQIMVIHAHLPGVEWDGTWEHVLATAKGHPVIQTQAVKTFMNMVDHRRMWPSPQQRQCTSDLKRGPIEREIRRYLKENPRYNGLVVNCMGLRAEESPGRAKQVPFKYNERNSKAGREWYDWLPIHDLRVDEVFATIAEAGEEPHWAYACGMSRLSCCFCIMSSREDLKTAATLNPKLYAAYVAKEREIDQTMLMPVNGERRFLEDVTGIPADLALLASEDEWLDRDDTTPESEPDEPAAEDPEDEPAGMCPGW